MAPCSCATRSRGFLRFWLARLTYEQKAQTDRVVGAVTGAPIVEASVVDGAVGNGTQTAPAVTES